MNIFSSFRSSWYLLDIFYLPTSPVASLVSGQVIGLLVLIALRCSSCLHAGIYRDFPSSGLLITFHHTSYFYIKNQDDKARNDEKDNESKVTSDETCFKKC